MRVTVVGAGYVGIASALGWSLTGHEVRVLDIDAQRIRTLAAGHDPLNEPLTDVLLRRRTIDFTSDAQQALAGSDVVALAVGTPMSRHGGADLSYIEAASETVAQHAPGTTVLIRSTVPVGTGDRLQRGLLHRNEVVSNPEFLREGSAVVDALRPDRVVAGGAPTSREVVDVLYGGILAQRFAPVETLQPAPEPRPLFWMDRRSAELTKYAANAFLVTKLSFVNEIANLAATLNADIRAVTGALGADPRIGRGYLRPGIGWGGSCFPKDSRALAAFAAESGYDLVVVRAAIEQNNLQLQRSNRALADEFRDRDDVRIGLLGLAFKGGTSDCRESPAVALAELLLSAGWRVTAYDPAVRADPALPEKLDVVYSAALAARDADALVIATEWPEFATVDLEPLARVMRGNLLFDGRCIVDPKRAVSAGLRYRGVCPPAERFGS